MKVPFRILFSNDTTNVANCVSPYHKDGEVFRPEMLEAAVDETVGKGIDVHMLQPGLCWVPWWQSKVLPMERHCEWVSKTYGQEPDAWAQYLLNGGDIVKVFVKRCREKGITPFLSFRLNDAHEHDKIYDSVEGQRPFDHCNCQFMYDNPQYSIGPSAHPEYRIRPGVNYFQGVQNWAIPKVREYKFSFIRELCENYDIDGFELDFLRFFSFFQLNKTTANERAEIMSGFVKQVRELLDQTAKPGQYRYLCARIPCYLDAHDELGIDVKRFAEAGVDMFNVSAHYFTDQQSDFRSIRQLAPNAAMYLETTQTTATGSWAGKERLTTKEQFYTAAHLAYENGFDGMSSFNFHYYRNWDADVRAEGNEPPFYVFEQMADRKKVAQQPQHYFIGNTYLQPPLGAYRQIPKMFAMGESYIFKLALAPPTGGWTGDGRLRLQTEMPFGESHWTVKVNGEKLKSTEDISEPYSNPYSLMHGCKKTLKAWIVPSNYLKKGTNDIEVTLEFGHSIEITFIDLAI